MPETPAATAHWDSIEKRNLDSPTSMGLKNTLSDSQNRAILIAGLSCACISFVAAFIALRWFVLMKRCFRHRLVLFLIASDTFKAAWYFVFGIVAISSGPVRSNSGFCQASGFFLMLGVEASDFAILLIALHTLLAIFKPTSRTGEGGLYPYRNWIYPIWLGSPLLFASLAFVGGRNAYVTSGAFCYLPKRPFWYRLTLSWVPRYLIISTILMMYISIYFYVRIKFRNFNAVLAGRDSSQKSARLSRQSIGPGSAAHETVTPPDPIAHSMREDTAVLPPMRPLAFRLSSFSSERGSFKLPATTSDAPWETLSFVTARPLQDQDVHPHAGVVTEDFAPEADSTESQSTKVSPRNLSISNGQSAQTAEDDRKASEAPTMQTNYTGDTAATRTTFDTTITTPETDYDEATDHLRQTRLAIRRQLRFLFLYPLLYILMWGFPFASHALNYDDYYVRHPIFWLSVAQVCSLGLQAGVDSVVFSLREKPWRRIDSDSRWSFPSFKGVVVGSIKKSGSNCRSNPPSAQTNEPIPSSTEQMKRSSSHWWEAEGRRRRDSVWMGTDTISRFASNRNQESNADHSESADHNDVGEVSSTNSRQ